ncbi:MAG: two-component system OmpR family response regulator [Alphaproteobacteria bacterium]|jgi:two-component system OmpR family response regulator
MDRRLLIVDDNQDFCDLMCLVAEDAGYETQGVYSAAAFRDTYVSFAPSNIVLDLAIPDEDGHELMRFLSDNKCTAKVAIASSQPDAILHQAEIFARALGLDFKGVLKKPFTQAEFLAVL